MNAAVVCAACGAKMRRGRTRCLRCGLPIDGPVSAKSNPGGRAVWVAAVTLVPAVVIVCLVGRPDPARLRETLPATMRFAVPVRPGSEPVSSPAATPPDAAMAWTRLDPDRAGRISYAQGDMAQALEHFRAAAEARPGDAEAASNYAQLLVRTGRPGDALPHLERAVRLQPDRWTYRFNLARCYGQLERWDAAVAAYRAAAGLFPDDYATHFNLGLALHRAGDEEGAAAELERAVEARPDDASFHLALGTTYERLGRRDEARTAFDRYLELAPDTPEAARLKAARARN